MSNTTNDKMNVNMSEMIQMLANSNKRSNSNPNSSYTSQSNNNQNIDLSPWIKQTRETLIKAEQRDLSRRIEIWTKIVNDSAKLMSQKLNFADAQLPVFTLKDLSPSQYLNFIMEWNPMDMNQLTKMETFEECLKNGRDWLNKRKGTKYALSLFPDFIRFAAKHSSNLGRFLYGNSARHQEMYGRTLMCQCIYHLFDYRITMPKEGSSQYLLCINCMKINPNQSQQNTIAQVVAGFAGDTQFYAKCTSHELKAKFFSGKFKKHLAELQESLATRQSSIPRSHSKSPSAPPLPPPPTSNPMNDDAQSAASSVFSTSSSSSKHHHEPLSMPSLQKPPDTNNINKRPSSTLSSSSMSSINKNDGHIQGCKTEKNDMDTNKKRNMPSNNGNHHSRQQMMNSRMNTRSNIFISNSAQHPNNNQINQLLNQIPNKNGNNANKHIMITQMMNNNNITTNQVNQMPIVTFTNQQHKMILHLLNQLISTYNRQQMNIVYLNNRVQQLECALAKQTAKVEAIELKANSGNMAQNQCNNQCKKHKHAHHRHHHNNNTTVNDNNNNNNNNNNNYQYKQPKFQGNRTGKVQNVNNKAASTPQINMQNVDPMSAQKILKAHGIELQQLLNLVQRIPQNQQMRNGMNAMNQQRPQNTNQNTPNNNNNNIIVNGNPNINQIQMRIPISSSSPSSPMNIPQQNSSFNMAALAQKKNNNQSNMNNADNFQDILKLLSTVGSGTQNAANNINVNNLMRNRGNMSNNNMNMNAMRNNASNSPKHQNSMNTIPTLGKNNSNINNMNNMNRHNAQNITIPRSGLNPSANVAALMMPSLPKLNAPNPNSNLNLTNISTNITANKNNAKNMVFKENKIKIKKQAMVNSQPPILGAPHQSNRKRNNRNDQNAVNIKTQGNQPPSKKRKVDQNNMNINNLNNNNNMNNNNNNNMNNLGNIMNNPMMIQMLLAQLSNNNGSQTQNQ